MEYANEITGGDWVVDGSLIVGAVIAKKYNGQGGVVIADTNPFTEYPTPDSKGKKANAAFIVTACNNHYQLLEALEAAQHEINAAILSTPTGEEREFLTGLNIKILSVLQNAKKPLQ